MILLVSLLIITSCGEKDVLKKVDTQSADVGSDGIVEDIETNTNEVEESSDIFDEEVMKIVERARDLDKWNYVVRSSNFKENNAEVTIFGTKMKIKVAPSVDDVFSHVFLDTDTKEAKGYNCKINLGKEECSNPTDVKYVDYYIKTPLDWLNEEDFLEAHVDKGRRKQIGGRSSTVAVVVPKGDETYSYWFDDTKYGGGLLEVEIYKDNNLVSSTKYLMIQIPGNVKEEDVLP